MDHKLKEINLTETFRKMGRAPVDPQVFNRAWFKVEERIAARQRPLLGHLVWKPWGHPIRWAAAAVLLFAAYSGALYNNLQEQDNLGEYVETISNPIDNLTKDTGIVHLSPLISEAPAPFRELLLSDENADNLANDDLSI